MKNQSVIHQLMQLDKNYVLSLDQSVLPPFSHYHYHDGCEVYLFLQGNAVMYVESGAFPLKPGSLFLFRPDELHRVACQDDSLYERVTLHIRVSCLQALSSDRTNLCSCFFNRPLGKENYHLFSKKELRDTLLLLSRLDSSLSAPCFGSDLVANSLLTEYLVLVNRLFQKDQKAISSFMPKLVKDTMQYMEEHLAEEISLQDLSAHLYHNGVYISHKFKEATGITLRQYLIHKRVILAKRLLSEGLSLTEVCCRSGFHDYSNFSRTFSKEAGCSPRQFQNRILCEKNESFYSNWNQ